MNALQLDRPLVVFDIESTGTDVATDRIITLSAMRITPENRTEHNFLCNPGRPIPAEATKVHGISDRMVALAPEFPVLAPFILDVFKGADLCGYNLRNFDVPLLWEEFNRSGINWSTDSARIIDASEIFRKKEPRTLTDAVKKFCGRDHAGAHDAFQDVLATWDVLNGQRFFYPDIGDMNVSALAEFSNGEQFEGQPAKRLDLCGYIIEDAQGVARFTLKKVRGVAVQDERGFAFWMLKNSFPENTKAVLRRLLNDQSQDTL